MALSAKRGGPGLSYSKTTKDRGRTLAHFSILGILIYLWSSWKTIRCLIGFFYHKHSSKSEFQQVEKIMEKD